MRDGKIVCHCVYEPIIPTPGGWSVQLGSIEDFGSLEVASKIAAKMRYNGFLRFDYRRTGDGFVMIERNLRSTAGAFLTPEEWIGPAVLGEPGELRVVEPGRRRQYDDRLLDSHLIRLPPARLIHELLTTPDAVLKLTDVLPSIQLPRGQRLALAARIFFH